MSLQSVKDFFAARQIDIDIIELPVSTATVALAAVAHEVEPGQIAKTLAFKLNDGRVVLVVAKGDARIDNKKYLDVSLKIYKEVIPAAGSVNSAVRISPEKMADMTQAEWVDVCQSQ
jgi:prolyl-tRNA editing enzyme YbaK/EbsC (Cys-tRNA(Pro) deacylase)